MITPSDREYKATKLIMLGERELKSDFKLLAERIEKKYGVKPINIKYDTIDKGKGPRLGIFFETLKEADSFKKNGHLSNFDSRKQKRIAEMFKQTFIEQGLISESKFFSISKKKLEDKYSTENIFVYTSAFEPVAKREANGKIPEQKIKELEKEINRPELWIIQRAFEAVIFFVHTDEQINQIEFSETHKNWTKKYFQLLKKYDEFDYFSEENFSITIDSKENFDNNYESNWFYYFK